FTTYNAVEPLLFKRSMGVSEVAQLVSAAFWGFLWGPVGLVLSAPLTVCLMVVGKYVPHLAFLDVLLGDESPLEPALGLYQRLLPWDEDDAARLVAAMRHEAKRHEGKRHDAKSYEVVADKVSENLLIPMLSLARRDRLREDITEEDVAFIVRATRAIL